jgi:hypothetical protein
VTTKLVLRVLGLSGELLGWTEVTALAKGDGALWAMSAVLVPVELAGTPTVLSIHWADVNVEVRAPMPGKPMSVGQSISIPHEADPMLRVGTPPVNLPAVTVRAASVIAPPSATMGGVSVGVLLK